MFELNVPRGPVTFVKVNVADQVPVRLPVGDSVPWSVILTSPPKSPVNGMVTVPVIAPEGSMLIV
jgi:hypothetical protein